MSYCMINSVKHFGVQALGIINYIELLQVNLLNGKIKSQSQPLMEKAREVGAAGEI